MNEQQIGHYTLIRQLGRGGYANVYLGVHHYLNTRAALKQLSGSPLPASDQYALAVMVYQWLCGQSPFLGSRVQICFQHLSTPPPSLRERVPSISRAVGRVVLKALSKNRDQRFAHVQEFASALKWASRAL